MILNKKTNKKVELFLDHFSVYISRDIIEKWVSPKILKRVVKENKRAIKELARFCCIYSIGSFALTHNDSTDLHSYNMENFLLYYGFIYDCLDFINKENSVELFLCLYLNNFVFKYVESKEKDSVLSTELI